MRAKRATLFRGRVIARPARAGAFQVTSGGGTGTDRLAPARKCVSAWGLYSGGSRERDALGCADRYPKMRWMETQDEKDSDHRTHLAGPRDPGARRTERRRRRGGGSGVSMRVRG